MFSFNKFGEKAGRNIEDILLKSYKEKKAKLQRNSLDRLGSLGIDVCVNDSVFPKTIDYVIEIEPERLDLSPDRFVSKRNKKYVLEIEKVLRKNNSAFSSMTGDVKLKSKIGLYVDIVKRSADELYKENYDKRSHIGNVDNLLYFTTIFSTFVGVVSSVYNISQMEDEISNSIVDATYNLLLIFGPPVLGLGIGLLGGSGLSSLYKYLRRNKISSRNLMKISYG